MKIAILAWGSLVWEIRSLKLASEWTPNGPILPIEFSRISDNGRLTLVIDEAHGVPVQTWFAQSAISLLPSAIKNLMEREGIENVDRVGSYECSGGKCSPRAVRQHPASCSAIGTWAKSQLLDAVLWTALTPRFQEKYDEAFSPEAAIRYLETLKGTAREDALRYIREAPKQVQTPVRALVQSRFFS